MTPSRLLPFGLAAALLPVAASLTVQGPHLAKIGDKVPSFGLDKMLNCDGRTNLDEFRGQPVLVDFWGTH